MQESEEEYKKKIYERMLNGKKLSEFEEEVKVKFIDEPAQMKLLIVVDKLLTGFDAPSATYLYIDKSMRNHDLFQAICRVNRPDGEDSFLPLSIRSYIFFLYSSSLSCIGS